jgi:hypothetical protein
MNKNALYLLSKDVGDYESGIEVINSTAFEGLKDELNEEIDSLNVVPDIPDLNDSTKKYLLVGKPIPTKEILEFEVQGSLDGSNIIYRINPKFNTGDPVQENDVIAVFEPYNLPSGSPDKEVLATCDGIIKYTSYLILFQNSNIEPRTFKIAEIEPANPTSYDSSYNWDETTSIIDNELKTFSGNVTLEINEVSGKLLEKISGIEDTIDTISGVYIEPDSSNPLTAGKRVLMQSVTFDDVLETHKINRWMVDIDNGDKISVPINVSGIISGIASIDRAVVNPDDTVGSPTKDKRVLLQTITFGDFDASDSAKQKVKAWMVDLDTGDKIPSEVDVSELVSGIASIDRAKVDPIPLDHKESLIRGKRVLMQAIDLGSLPQTGEAIDNDYITLWRVDLDTGQPFSINITLKEIFTEPVIKYLRSKLGITI